MADATGMSGKAPDKKMRARPRDQSRREGLQASSGAESDTGPEIEKIGSDEVVGGPHGVSDYLASEIGALDSMRNEEGDG